jgi:hypothetical protein
MSLPCNATGTTRTALQAPFDFQSWYTPNAASAAPTTMSGVGLLVRGRRNCPLAPAPIATRPNPKFHTPDFMDAILAHMAARLLYPLAMAPTPATMSKQPNHLSHDTVSPK